MSLESEQASARRDPKGAPDRAERRPPIDPRLLRHAPVARRFLLVCAILAAGTGAAAIAHAHLLAGVISDAFVGGAGLSALAFALALWALVWVCRGALAWATEVAARRAASGARSALRRALFRRIGAEGPAALAQKERGALAVTATRGLEALDGYFAGYLPQLVAAAVVPAMALLWILPRDPLSVVLLAITLPLIPLFMALIGLWAARRVQAQWRAQKRLGGHFLEVVTGLQTLKTLGAARRQSARVAEVTDRYRASTMSALRVAFLSAGWLELIATIGTAMLAVGVGLRLVDGTLELHTGLAILILAPEIYAPVRAVGQQFHASMEGREAAADVLAAIEDADSGPERSGLLDGAASAGAKAPEAGAARVELGGVTVVYAAGDEPAVCGLDLRIEPGERLAIMGPTGAGKSTILSLLLGFVAPTRGTVALAVGKGERDPAEPSAPVDLAALDLASWRAQLSWVPQTPHLIAGTVEENVRLSRPEARAGELDEVAGRVGLDEVLGDLPGGWKEAVGEGGVPLSGGQRRRVALARALLRRPGLLLCDEPTADLDPISAARVAPRLFDRRAAETVVAVTHSPELARLCDRVAIVEGGRVADVGPREDVFARSRFFAELARAEGGAGRAGGNR